MEPTTLEIKEIYDQLPTRIKEIIDSGNWKQIVRQIAQANGLTEDETVALIDEVLVVMMGINHPADFQNQIKSIITSGEAIEQIVSEINEKIFREYKLEEIYSTELDQRLNALPEKIRKALTAASTETAILDIGKKYDLHVDQIGKLVEAVTQTLLGQIKPYQFDDYIANQLSIEPAKANLITSDINNQIFLPIRDSLEKMSEQSQASPAKLPTPNIFEEKMSGMFDLNEEVEEDKVDPYREPIT